MAKMSTYEASFRTSTPADNALWKVERAWMDGTHREAVRGFNKTSHWHYLALDRERQKLYFWADGALQRMSVNGSELEVRWQGGGGRR